MVILSASNLCHFHFYHFESGHNLYYNYIKFLFYSLLPICNFEKFFDVIQLKVCGKIFFLLNLSSLTKPNYLPLSHEIEKNKNSWKTLVICLSMSVFIIFCYL